jgi:hypothetical protein
VKVAHLEVLGPSSWKSRIERTEIPKVSAACHQVVFLASTRKSLPKVFLARSQASSGHRLILPRFSSKPYPKTAAAEKSHANSDGYFTC